MRKDQVIGASISAACIIAALTYTGLLFFYDPYIKSVINLGTAANVQFNLISTPVHTAVFAVVAIGAWVGYNKATMPPPKIFDLTKEPITQNKPTKK
jgi:hypothetical protein